MSKDLVALDVTSLLNLNANKRQMFSQIRYHASLQGSDDKDAPMAPDDSANPTLLEGERRKNLHARDVINFLINLHAIASSSKFNLTEK